MIGPRTMLQAHLYRRAEWIQFREEVLELDGYRCRRCPRHQRDGVVLQVHHLRYEDGKMPWEYPYSDCETLCQGCHAREHRKIAPVAGWEYGGHEDLENESGVCDWCGTSIRHVFSISHPTWFPLEVGTDCCDNLTDSELASNKVESLTRFMSRQKCFLTSKRWKSVGQSCRITQKSFDIVIAPGVAGFHLQMNAVRGKAVFGSVEAARKHVFEIIEDGRAGRYLSRHRRER